MISSPYSIIRHLGPRWFGAGAAATLILGAASGFLFGQLVPERTDAHRAIIAQTRMLETLPQVQAYNQLMINSSGTIAYQVNLPERELLENPRALAELQERTQALENLVAAESVRSYVQLRQEPTSEPFSWRHARYGSLAGGVIVPALAWAFVYLLAKRFVPNLGNEALGTPA